MHWRSNDIYAPRFYKIMWNWCIWLFPTSLFVCTRLIFFCKLNLDLFIIILLKLKYIEYILFTNNNTKYPNYQGRLWQWNCFYIFYIIFNHRFLRLNNQINKKKDFKLFIVQFYYLLAYYLMRDLYHKMTLRNEQHFVYLNVLKIS